MAQYKDKYYESLIKIKSIMLQTGMHSEFIGRILGCPKTVDGKHKAVGAGRGDSICDLCGTWSPSSGDRMKEYPDIKLKTALIVSLRDIREWFNKHIPDYDNELLDEYIVECGDRIMKNGEDLVQAGLYCDCTDSKNPLDMHPEQVIFDIMFQGKPMRSLYYEI